MTGVMLLAAAPTARAADVLRVSAISGESPTELQRKFAPLGAYLEKAIGMQVQFTPVSDYPATVEALAAGKLDLVWYGGFTFVQARRRTGTAIPLVPGEEDAQFHSILDLQRAKRFIETKPEDYVGIEQAAKAAGLIKDRS